MSGAQVGVADGSGVQVDMAVGPPSGFWQAPNVSNTKKGNIKTAFNPVDFQTLVRNISMLLLNLLDY